MIKNGASVSEDSFVFNLGRLWEVAILEHWDDAVYLYEFIQKITSPEIKKRYSKELEDLGIEIERRCCEGVDKALEKILKW